MLFRILSWLLIGGLIMFIYKNPATAAGVVRGAFDAMGTFLATVTK